MLKTILTTLGILAVSVGLVLLVPRAPEPVAGGLSKLRIGQQVAWTSDLVPSNSYTVNLGSSANPVNNLFSTNASVSGRSEFGVDALPVTTSTRVQFNDADGSLSDWAFRVSGTGYGSVYFAKDSGTLASPSAAGLNTQVGSLEFLAWKSGAYRNIAEIVGYTDSSSVINPGLLRIVSNTTTSGYASASIGYFPTSFKIPSLSGGLPYAVTGGLAYDTASNSLNVYNGAEKVIAKNEQCFGYPYLSPSAKKQFTLQRFTDPFTITSIMAVASGTNAAGWNLLYGAPGTVTTAVFSVPKSASTSLYPKYTSFANSTLADMNVLDIKISSTSSKISSIGITVCGSYAP